MDRKEVGEEEEEEVVRVGGKVVSGGLGEGEERVG